MKSLSEQYACRAREFSDTVARLAPHERVSGEVLGLFREIRRRHALCCDAEQKLERYIQQKDDESKVQGAA
jgi:hypothetical protein